MDNGTTQDAAADWETRVRRQSFDLERSFSDRGGRWDRGPRVDPLCLEMRPESLTYAAELDAA